jgi:hypothetical protein
VQIEGAYVTEMMKLMKYVESKEDLLIQIVRTHQHHTKSTLLQTVNNFKKSFQSETERMQNVTAQSIEGRRMQRQFSGSLDEIFVDKEQSYGWLKFGDRKGETESTVVVRLG